ncbi:MAG TPA: Mov34/MPN/PAD-1 family protein [Polyangiaceae bacterium]|nr:Mov34/MPN/PAD-1 family protein [Polyangiaceae bacterium]
MSGREQSDHPAWIRGGLAIPRAALAEVERAARDAYARDEEACGYLYGPSGDPLRIDGAVELENLANKYHAADPEGHPRTGREYFKINALKFERAVSEGAAAGRPVKVFFHSHLDCGAYFSAEDAASMTMGGSQAPTHPLSYLVTAVDQGRVTAHKLFIWDDETRGFVEAPFTEVVE